MISEENLFGVCKNYLNTIGVPNDSIMSVLEKNNYDVAAVSSLSSVNIIKENRTASKRSNQTHIHITGEAMQAFYPSNEISSVYQSTDDSEINVLIFAKNLSELRERSTSYAETTRYSADQILNMKTVKKIAFRKPSGKQVQLSKVSLDSDNFTELRSYLFEGDTLYIFKSLDSFENYFLVAIPKVNSTEVNTSKQRPSLVKISKQNTFFLKDVTPSTIATIAQENLNAEYLLADEESQVNTIQARAEKTRQHQNIVSKLAQKILDSSKFRIMAGNIDCFAVDEENDVSLIFEIKTLDSTPNGHNEVSQVRKAFSQLFYYDAFAKKEFESISSHKIAVFSENISNDHKKFFEDNNCSVIWMENNEFCYNGDEEIILNIFNRNLIL